MTGKLIEDAADRQVASSAVKAYADHHLKLRSEAEKLIKDDTLAKARCVHTLKLTLNHGQFYDVCEKALGLHYQTASALASTGKLLMEGDHTDEVLEMVKVMEPRAAKKFLQADEEKPNMTT